MLHHLAQHYQRLCLLLALCWMTPLYAQYSRLFSTDNELPNSLINQVIETADEMIWIATEDGLCRFDGSDIFTYRHQEGDSCSLANDFVRTICSDNKGHLLVGTIWGVQMYRPATNDFTPVLVNEELGIVRGGNCSRINILNNGDFLATGNATYNIHISDDGELEPYANGFTQSFYMTYRGAQDGMGDLWVSQLDGHLYHLDSKGEIHTLSAETPTNFIALCSSQDGILYCSGEDGHIYRYNRATEKVEQVTKEPFRTAVRDIKPIKDLKQMYLATDGDGVKILDCLTGNISSLIFDDPRLDATSLKVHSILNSANGDTWMGLYQKGVYVMARNPLNFHYYGPKSLRYNCVGQNCITSIIRASDGNIWVATDNGGMYSVNEHGKTLCYYPCSPLPGSLPSAIMNIYEDSKHRVWYGSYRQGGGIIDLKTGVCRSIPISSAQGETSNIYAFAEDKRGTIWVASMGNGILKYDEKEKVFVPYEVNYAVTWSCSMFYDRATDRLYIGSYTGLCTIDLSQEEPTNQQDLMDFVIFSIIKSSDTTLSLCTNRGLVIYDCTSGNYKAYTTADGLASNFVYASQTDGEGNLWVSGNAGLTKMNMREEVFTNYTAQDGLQGNEFYKNASMRDTNGTLWFGGTNGITWFNPHEILFSKQTVQGRIVSLRADQNLILPDDKGCFKISEEDHSFTIQLATRPIMLSNRVQYRYSMDGDPWQTLPPRLNRVSFSHISSGNHTFQFQAVGEGIESEISSARIYIEYPWYNTSAALIVWALLLGIIIYLLVRLVRRIRESRRIEREHQQEVAINEAKLQFFMNIAHEFRTPMTLIMSPLNKLMSTDKDASHQRSYQIMNRNASRILGLTNQLMDLRKIDKGQMKLSCQEIDIFHRIQETFDNFVDLSEVRKVAMKLTLPEEAEQQGWIDPDILDKVMTNLISNAIKYTPEGGAIDVLVSILSQSNDRRLKISITDTGIGISAEDKERIFERFYRVRKSETQTIGTGIGLNLVHALIQLHHGQIEVTDNPTGRGTRFTIELPIEESAYTDTERMRVQEEEAEQLHPEIDMNTIALSSLSDNLPSVEEESRNGIVRRHILLAEDDDEVRNYLVQELSPLYKVTTANNGQEAWDKLIVDETIDIVLSDVMMPIMEGTVLCQKIRQNIRLNHLPVILLTAKATDEDRLQSLEIGANAFIPKPFNIEILLKTIKNLLESQARLRNTFSGQQLPTEKVSTPELQSPDERLLQRIIKVIDDNLGNADLTTDFIAHEVGLSRVHLYRKLKELTNQSARNYIRNIRLAKAAELLSQKKMSVAEVAYLTGFSNPNNFSTAFHELYGMSPKDYMEKNQTHEADTASK